MPSTAMLDALATAGIDPSILDGFPILPAPAGTKPAAPAATTTTEVTPMPETTNTTAPETPAPDTPKVKRPRRTLRKLTTKELCERVERDDLEAVAEAIMRFKHANTLQPQNRRMISAALAAYDLRAELSGIASEIDPPAPAPVKPAAPEVAPEVAAAATEYAKRIKALVAKDRVRASIRARKQAISEGLTIEDLEDATDEDLLALFEMA